MNQLVASYYLGERSTALIGLAFGLLLFAVSIGMWRACAPGTIARGAAHALLAFGLLQATASGAYLATLSRVSTAHSATMSDIALKADEIKRMEGVLAGTGYTGALIFFSTIIAAGLSLALFFRDRPQLVGIGLALMAYGVAGHIFESISIEKNRAYLRAVRELVAKNTGAEP